MVETVTHRVKVMYDEETKLIYFLDADAVGKAQLIDAIKLPEGKVIEDLEDIQVRNYVNRMLTTAIMSLNTESETHKYFILDDCQAPAGCGDYTVETLLARVMNWRAIHQSNNENKQK